MGKVIDISDFCDRSEEIVTFSGDDLQECELTSRAELTATLEDDDFFPSYFVCNDEFDYSDTIYHIEAPTTEKDLEWYDLLFHKSCPEIFIDNEFLETPKKSFQATKKRPALSDIKVDFELQKQITAFLSQ